MLTTLLTVLFSGLVWQQTSLADESFGYLIQDGFYNTPCTTDPMPGECSFGHEVAVSEITQSQAGAILSQLMNILRMALGDTERTSTEPCVTTAQDYFCKMAFPLTCKDEYIVQDIEGVKKSCKKAEKYCTNVTGGQSFMLHAVINCSRSMEPVEPIKRQSFQCKHFPDVKDGPLTCAKRNYKVFSGNLTEQARTQVASHERLVKYASNISQECLNDVSEVICKTVAPACDTNETMVVSLLSRQECERITSCLNTTSKVKNLKEGFLEWCRYLPDASTAKKIPLSLVYTEFEHNTTPKTHNDTKISTTPTTKSLVRSKTAHSQSPISSLKPTAESLLNQNYTLQDQLSIKLTKTPQLTKSPVPSKTAHSQSPNATGESYNPKTPTEKPYQNSTDQNTSAKPATILSKSTPTTQANMTTTNTKAKPTTEKPTLNVTSEPKSAPSLKPTAESLLNQNYTSQDQLSIKLTETPQLNATSSPVVGQVNATGRPVFNVTTVFNITVTRPSFSVSANCSNSTSPNCNKAANTKMNGLVVLVISSLSIWMW